MISDHCGLQRSDCQYANFRSCIHIWTRILANSLKYCNLAKNCLDKDIHSGMILSPGWMCSLPSWLINTSPPCSLEGWQLAQQRQSLWFHHFPILTNYVPSPPVRTRTPDSLVVPVISLQSWTLLIYPLTGFMPVFHSHTLCSMARELYSSLPSPGKK